MKVLADDNSNLTPFIEFVFGKVENIVGIGNNYAFFKVNKSQDCVVMG